MKKYFHINIFTEKHQWWCHLKYSCRFVGLELYLKGAQADTFLVKSVKFCTEHYLLLGNCFWFPTTCLTLSLALSVIYSYNTSCWGTPKIATFRGSSLLALKCLKEIRKKQVESNILVLKACVCYFLSNFYFFTKW